MRYRCPKNGRFVGYIDCMICIKPPKGFHEEGLYCISPEGKKYTMWYDYCYEHSTGQDMSING